MATRLPLVIGSDGRQQVLQAADLLLRGVDYDANFNVSVCTGALAALTSGTNNLAIGKDAGNAVTTGSFSVSVGNGSGTSLTDAVESHSFGYNAQNTSHRTFMVGSSNGSTIRFYSRFIAGVQELFPADSEIRSKEVLMAFDSTNGAANVAFRGKQADATVVNVLLRGTNTGDQAPNALGAWLY